MAQIARLLTLDKSSVTGLVDRAESRGYVKRTTTVEDGRSILVTLTPEGRGIINRVALDVAREIHSIADMLSDTERARLSQTASKLVHLDAAARGIDLQTGRRESAVSSRKGA